MCDRFYEGMAFLPLPHTWAAPLNPILNSVKETTYSKDLEILSCTDLVLTKFQHFCSFQNLCALETDLSDFHRTIITVTKAKFENLKPNKILGLKA